MEKSGLKGINISSELVLMNVYDFDENSDLLSALLHAFKMNKINTPFLSTSFSQKESAVLSCCFAKQDTVQITDIIQDNETLKKNSHFISGVGLLSVFPHRSSLNALGLSLAAISRSNISVLGMSSSISSLIFVLKYYQLSKAINSLRGCFSRIEGIK